MTQTIRPFRVVIADDEKPALTILRHCINWTELNLELAGCVQSGRELLEILQREKMDIAIVDIRMPGLSGLEAIEEIHKFNPQIHILIISAYPSFRYARTAMQLGVEDFLPKPIIREEVNQALSQMVGKMRTAASPVTDCSMLILQVKHYVHMHIGEDLSLGTVANQVYVTPNYLCARFKKETGQNFVDYVTQTRVEEARRMLPDLSLSISQIAEKVGYKDSRYFSRVFKKHTGYFPKDFRIAPRDSKNEGMLCDEEKEDKQDKEKEDISVMKEEEKRKKCGEEGEKIHRK
ncbi:MAG: response regulator [Robinsoniella sp.]|nr:response regulator [Robinsoniella sp.]